MRMFLAKQINSLEKVRQFSTLNYTEITRASVLQGERFSYQIAMRSDYPVIGNIRIESPISDCIRVYKVEQSVMDAPTTESTLEIGYITTEPGIMPDLLIPMDKKDFVLTPVGGSTLWVEVNLPYDMKPGEYTINFAYDTFNFQNPEERQIGVAKKTMTLEVLPVKKKEQSLIYTRWFYADCIATYHNVEIYSEEHFKLIEAYIREAVDVGINMILVPIHTPPLDTAIGTQRPCVQLVDIKKVGDRYEFGFDKLRRFVDICKRAGVRYYEMAHMFSQWGAKCAANIMVEENGVKDYMFGWHVESTSEVYIDFLKQYISALSSELTSLGIAKNTYYHISDEPTVDKIEAYKTAVDIIRPFIGKSKTFDALSSYEFYERGLVECPVTAINHMNDFLPYNIPNQWVYYCCGPQRTYSNSFIAMQSWRTRILGVLLYKYDIKGFLQWGFNFYNSLVSYYAVNPYVTTSCEGRFPSGDPFIVYPSKSGAYPSIRGKVTYEAIGDMDLCRTLEEYIGRDEVIKIIDSVADMDVRFDSYPQDSEYLPKLRDALIARLREFIK